MNELKVIEETKEIVDVTNYKEVAIDWLSSMGLNLQENHKKQFVDICCAYGLNPIKKEVYGIPYGDKFNIIVGYEVYIKNAERSGKLNGWKVEIVGSGKDMKAVITINRKDWTSPFVHEVYFEEYNTGKSLWASKPRTMLKKVAIAQGFRMCFSEILGGIPYTADELPEEMTTTPTPIEKVVNESSHKVSVESPKNNNKIAPKYTKEQALQLAEVMNAKINETSVFSDEEKESYRQMLKDGLFEDAYKSASDLLETRKAASDDIPEGIF